MPIEPTVSPKKFVTTRFLHRRPGTGLPDRTQLGESVAKGSNSSVQRASLDSFKDLVFRAPRHESDTIRQSHAQSECELAILADRWGVGPRVIDAWYCSRTTKFQKKGLHMLMEGFPYDLSSLVLEHTELALCHAERVAKEIASKLYALADRRVLLYDLKPCNVVVRLGEQGDIQVRLIDFGHDYVERQDGDVLRDIRSALHNEGLSEDSMPQVVGLLMLVMLSATHAHQIHQARRELKTLSLCDRQRLNGLHALLARERVHTPGRIVRVLKSALRSEPIRCNLRHYLGARNSGTKRVLQWANFQRAKAVKN